MGLFGNEPEKVKVVCKDESSNGDGQKVVCRIYQDDEEVSTVTIKASEDGFEFEATNPKYLGTVLKELKRNGII